MIKLRRMTTGGKAVMIAVFVAFFGLGPWRPSPTAVTGLAVTVVDGNATELEATVLPLRAANRAVTWSLSDPAEIWPGTVEDYIKMETVSEARVRLTPLRAFAGAATLTARSVENPAISADYTLRFGERLPVISLPLLQAGTPTAVAPVPVQSPARIDLHCAGPNLFDAAKVAGDYAGLKVTHNPDGTFNLRGVPTRETASPTDGVSLMALSGLEAGDAPYILLRYGGNQSGGRLLGLSFYDEQGSLIGNYDQAIVGRWFHSESTLASPAATVGLLVQNLTPGVYTEIDNIRIDVRKDAPAGGYLPYENRTIGIAAPKTITGNAVELYGGVAGAENTIEYRAGKLYLIQRTGKLVFDGSADEGWYAPGVSGDLSRVRMATTRYGNLLKKGSQVKPKALWTIGTAAQWDDPLMGKVNNSFSINTEGDLTILTFYADKYSTDNALTRWKAYLAEHPSEFYFELETPVRIELDPASLPALEYRSSGYTVTSDVEGLNPALGWVRGAA